MLRQDRMPSLMNEGAPLPLFSRFAESLDCEVDPSYAGRDIMGGHGTRGDRWTVRRLRDLSRKTFWPPVAELHPALQPIRDSMTRAFRSVLLMLVIPVGLVAIAGVACVELVSSDPLTASEVAAVKAELADRSFRRFEPHVDGDLRKGVILDFFGPLSLWAQYAERGHALNEWEIVADDYRVERAGSGQVMTLYPVAARAVQQLPTECRGCID